MSLEMETELELASRKVTVQNLCDDYQQAGLSTSAPFDFH